MSDHRTKETGRTPRIRGCNQTSRILAQNEKLRSILTDARTELARLEIKYRFAPYEADRLDPLFARIDRVLRGSEQ